MDLTELGNPAKPAGKAGAQMLARMNKSHGPMTEWALGFLEYPEDGTALDVGCGGGATLERLADRMPAGKIHGVDYSETSVAESRQRCRDGIAAGRITVERADVEHLPFQDSTFDLVTTVESLYFWPRPEAGLLEIRRVLKRSGRLLIVMEIYKNGKWSERDRENVSKYKLFVPGMEEYRTLLFDAGFSLVQFRTHPAENWIAVIADA